MLARPRRWRIERGDGGKARVIVDEPELVVRTPERPPERPPGHMNSDLPPDQPDESILSALLRRRSAQLEAAAELAGA
jgi:hypothetical protein